MNLFVKYLHAQSGETLTLTALERVSFAVFKALSESKSVTYTNGESLLSSIHKAAAPAMLLPMEPIEEIVDALVKIGITVDHYYQDGERMHFRIEGSNYSFLKNCPLVLTVGQLFFALGKTREREKVRESLEELKKTLM